MKTPTSISDFDPKKMLAHHPTKPTIQEQKIILQPLSNKLSHYFEQHKLIYKGFILLPIMITSIYPQTNSAQTEQSEQKVRFPEDIQVIIRSDQLRSGNLFLSNLEAAQNIKILQNLRITAVVTTVKGKKLKHPKDVIKATKYIPLEDDQKCQIQEFLDETVTFISTHLKETNVLVHCIAGVSRSAAFVIAYLMRQRQLSLEDAFNEVKSRRKTICPSKHLLEQLKKYEKYLSQKQLPIQHQNNSHRMPTTSNKSQLSHPRENITHNEISKSFFQNKHNQSHFMAEDFDLKSRRSQRSKHTQKADSKIFIEVKAPNPTKNPQEIDTPNKSTHRQKSQLDKSFASRSHSERRQNENQERSEAHQLSFNSKKLSESRNHFTKKMHRVDELNEKLNDKFELIQQRFETENKAHRQTLENELSQISKMKSNLCSQYNSERKSKFAMKRSLHNQSMEDKPVKEYILSSLPDHQN